MREFPRVQIVTVLKVLSFLPQGHTGAAETFPSTAGPALRRSPKAALGRGRRTSLICNFKKQNKILTKKLSVAARLGDDFEMGQSFNEIY